jgi:hypothetical protein
MSNYDELLSDTRSEYEKGLDLPQCGKCGGVAARCRCSFVWTLPSEWGPCSIVSTERAARQAREDQERERAETLIAQGRMSPSMLETLGLQRTVLRGAA